MTLREGEKTYFQFDFFFCILFSLPAKMMSNKKNLITHVHKQTPLLIQANENTKPIQTTKNRRATRRARGFGFLAVRSDAGGTG